MEIDWLHPRIQNVIRELQWKHPRLLNWEANLDPGDPRSLRVTAIDCPAPDERSTKVFSITPALIVGGSADQDLASYVQCCSCNYRGWTPEWRRAGPQGTPICGGCVSALLKICEGVDRKGDSER